MGYLRGLVCAYALLLAEAQVTIADTINLHFLIVVCLDSNVL